jgi:ABC-type multidrug transport system fused ATPase/permease subunit
MNTTKKFLRITREVFSIYWAISPGLLLTILVTNILLTVQPLINAYVFSYVLDKIISFVGQGQVSALQVLPIVAILGVVNLISGLVANINDYGNSLLSSQDIYKLRLKQIDFMAELGIAQMEDPELTNKVTRFNEVYAQISQHLSILISLVSLIVSVAISGAVLFHIQSGMVLVFLTLFVLKYFNNTRFRNKIWYLTRDNTEERRDAWTSASWLSEPMFLKEILISGGSLLLRKKFLGFVEWFYKEYSTIRTRWAFYETFHTVLDVALFSFGVYLVVEKGLAGAISIGLITFYVRTLISFADQMDTLSYRLGRSIESSIRIQDALELFELYKPEVDGTDILPTPTVSE